MGTGTKEIEGPPTIHSICVKSVFNILEIFLHCIPFEVLPSYGILGVARFALCYAARSLFRAHSVFGSFHFGTQTNFTSPSTE